MKQFVKDLVHSYEEPLKEIRHHLHENPELSFEEYRTAEYIRKALESMGIAIQDGIHRHQHCGLPEGAGRLVPASPSGQISTLFLWKKTTISPINPKRPASCTPAAMTPIAACLLVLARILSEHPELVKGTVKFIFQAAEEKLPGGAKALCADHALDGVDMVFGMHSSSNHPLGTITLSHSSSSAAIGIYEVTIHGKGGHGSAPHNAKNPVPVACLLASALNQILAEKKAPADTGVFTVSYINGGQYPNIITDTVTLGGNIRTQDNALIQQIFGHIDSISHGASARPTE